ncbi:MAG: transposase [Rhodomicrobium sp.]|nr:transposase [Rhodomicrobium sp.]
MTRAYSIDLRERVVERALAGESIRTIATIYAISPSSVVKWSGRFRRTGSIAPAKMGGYKPVILSAHRDFIHRRFAEEPNLPLRRLQQELADRNIKISYGAIWKFVHAEGLSFKKNRARKRTGQTRCRQTAVAVEEVSKPD